MPIEDHFVLMVAAGAFLLIGAVFVIWGKAEEKGYYNALVDRADMREYLNHWPQRVEFGALKVGGWIALAIGIILLLVGGGLWLWG